jgi:hypothetical protein
MTPALPRRDVLGAALAGVALAATAAGTAAAQPTPGTPADLSFPDTTLAREAHHLVTEAQDPYLRNHSLRSFLFARAAAAQAGRRPGEDYDAELMFLICVLHDMGLTDRANTDQRFEVDGADFAARFLEDRGLTDRRVDTVWDGIALHTSRGVHESPVFSRRRPPEIGIAQDGIGIDLLGNPDQFPAGYADLVHAAYPRLGGARALTDGIVAQGLANPRKALPMTLPGEILHQRRPTQPYTTWDMILDTGGWGD